MTQRLHMLDLQCLKRLARSALFEPKIGSCGCHCRIEIHITGLTRCSLLCLCDQFILTLKLTDLMRGSGRAQGCEHLATLVRRLTREPCQGFFCMAVAAFKQSRPTLLQERLLTLFLSLPAPAPIAFRHLRQPHQHANQCIQDNKRQDDQHDGKCQRHLHTPLINHNQHIARKPVDRRGH